MTWSFNRVVLAMAIVLALASSALTSRAEPQALSEPTAADVETAKLQFTEGRDLRDKGDLPGALTRFRAAYALVPTPITGLEVGRTLVATGKVLEGRALLLEVARMPKKAGESEQAQAARDEAATLAEQARAKLATLTIETDLTVDPAVTVDDAPIPRDAVQAPRVLDFGHHVIVVRARGRVGRIEVDLQPGEQRQAHVDATQQEAVVPPPRTELRHHTGPVFYGAVITSAATLAIGVGTGIGALATASSLSGACPNHQCPPSEYGQLDASSALGWVSTVAFATSGVFAVVAVIAYIASGKREATARLRLGPGVLSGSF